MGCWSPNRPDFGGRWPVSGVDPPPRTPRCFSASSSKATYGLQASVPDYDVSSKTGFCGAMPRSEPSATPPLSQRPASENGDGSLPRGGIWSSSCARLPGTRDNTIAELDLPGRPTSSIGPAPPTGSARRVRSYAPGAGLPASPCEASSLVVPSPRVLLSGAQVSRQSCFFSVIAGFSVASRGSITSARKFNTPRSFPSASRSRRFVTTGVSPWFGPASPQPRA